jgi:cytochrome c-type biogenesis protein CcmH
MIGFALAAVALLAVGIAVMLWPLLRSGEDSGAPKAGAVVELFREKLRDLDAERKSGAIEAAQYEQSRRELERQLLDAVALAADPGAAGPARARWSALAVGLFLFVVPIALYVNIGAPTALMPGAIRPADGERNPGAQAEGAGRRGAGPLTNAQVEKMIGQMNEALTKSPNDVQGWTMLARAHAYLRQYPEAVRAFTRAVAIKPKDARLLADLADAMAMANGQRLDGEPMRLIDRALSIDPSDLKALALAGTAAFDQQEYGKAVIFWERALKAAPNDPEFANSLRPSLEEARQLAAGKGAEAPPAASAEPAAGGAAQPAVSAGAGVRGRVVLSGALASKAQPGDTVFVFARAAQGPKLPLALLRRQVKDLPFEFVLDDTMAMVPEYTLSKFTPVVVGARISRSGDAIAAAGDLQGFSQPVPAGASGVKITIDQVVQ